MAHTNPRRNGTGDMHELKLILGLAPEIEIKLESGIHPIIFVFLTKIESFVIEQISIVFTFIIT